MRVLSIYLLTVGAQISKLQEPNPVVNKEELYHQMRLYGRKFEHHDQKRVGKYLELILDDDLCFEEH